MQCVGEVCFVSFGLCGVTVIDAGTLGTLYKGLGYLELDLGSSLHN